MENKKTIERNKRIVGFREEGWIFNEISEEVGVSVNHVNNLYCWHCARPDDKVPTGMSIITGM